jgi:large subunit ribosomal protein L10
MPTAEKAQTIEEAKELYSRSKGVVFTDYRGLKVKEMQQLRANLKAKGGELHVLKNTLFRRAAGDDIAQLTDEMHNGPTAVAFIFEDEAACAKTLVDYAQTNKKLTVKGGFFGGRMMTAQDVTTLSKLPPRDVLLAQVIGAIAAPLSQLVGVVEALYADPIRVIGAVADKVAEGSPIPEAKAEAEPAADNAPANEVPAEAPAEAPTEAAPEAAEPAPEAEAAPEGETPQE